MSSENLERSIESAFKKGDNQLGLERLREFNASVGLANPASTNRQAVIEEQIGDWALAGKAHYQCISLAPNVASAYLYAGYWLENSKRLDAAASLYSLASELDPNLFSQHHEPNGARGIRTLAGLRCLLTFLTHHHTDMMTELGAPARIRNSRWPQTDSQGPFHSDSSDREYKPQLFYIPEISQKRYHDPLSFGWAAELMNSCGAIKKELLAAMKDQTDLRPYLESARDVPDNLAQLAGSMHWSALDLYKNGRENQEVSSKFPKTLQALEAVPTYAEGDQDSNHPFEVFFSVLEPKQTISPHYGQSNHSLTVHLPIEIPDNCYLEVAGEKHEWQTGELVIFDDNYLHSAYNNSDKTRVVLIFSIWHPDLSYEERECIQAAFAARSTWMLSRGEKIAELIR